MLPGGQVESSASARAAMHLVHRYYGDDFCVVEHEATGTVSGELLGVSRYGRRVTSRMLRVWEWCRVRPSPPRPPRPTATAPRPGADDANGRVIRAGVRPPVWRSRGTVVADGCSGPRARVHGTLEDAR
ncbi:MAG: hypothetical protein ACRDXC_02780 [Acidimicrobiales bacterium]